MRQIGTLPTQTQADRFTAFLVTQGISAVAEPEKTWWTIWVREEDHVARARDALEDFRRNSDDPRYRGVVREASAVLQAEAKRRDLARKNVIPVGGGRWGQAGARATPLTAVVIALCVVLFVLSGFGRENESVAMRSLSFCDIRHNQQDNWDPNRIPDRMIDIRRGEWWRLVTPIFLHGDTLHLLFNMIMFHVFARLIETRKGAAALGLLILLIAVPSNAAQGLAPSNWGTLAGGPSFLGISGVVYGLMGYLWMKTVYHPGSGLYVSAGTVVFLLGWMTIGLTGVLSDSLPIANLAHVIGLLSGMLLGYLTSPRT